MCPHEPSCPSAEAPGPRGRPYAGCHPEQGWSLLCNGVVLFEDTGELLPDGAVIEPHRPLAGAPDHHAPNVTPRSSR